MTKSFSNGGGGEEKKLWEEIVLGASVCLESHQVFLTEKRGGGMLEHLFPHSQDGTVL